MFDMQHVSTTFATAVLNTSSIALKLAAGRLGVRGPVTSFEPRSI